ncbi:MAG TPA: zinc-binding dehydrogenase [Candidatus Cybelea sp.]|nr:zinc-binding dehydrogenase [Candidatus Cybelea sp.]
MASGTMRAVVVAKDAPGKLAIRETPKPAPRLGEALVKVAAVSLNRGETRRALSMADNGWIPGWDFAGTVETPASDGSGPRAGARVVGLVADGAWAEYVAAPTPVLAELPRSVSFAAASTLPVAGLTALHALAKGGLLLGRKVLIGGATGGVGSFACQLARLSGAHVVAAIRNREHESLVKRLGADEAAVGADVGAAASLGPFHLVLESVGGPSLAAAIRMLAPGGTCVLFGVSGAAETTFDARELFRIGAASLYGLILFDEIQREPAGIGLARLGRLIADGKLKPAIEVEARWTEVAGVAARLIERRFTGKAVLTF